MPTQFKSIKRPPCLRNLAIDVHFSKPLESYRGTGRNIHITQDPRISVDLSTFKYKNEEYYIHYHVVIAYWCMYAKLSMQCTMSQEIPRRYK